jgi:hypothetical protein
LYHGETDRSFILNETSVISDVFAFSPFCFVLNRHQVYIFLWISSSSDIMAVLPVEKVPLLLEKVKSKIEP